MSLPATPDDAREVERMVRSGKRDEALARLDKLLAAKPDDAALRFLKGVLLSEMQRPADAQAVFERMTEDFPDLPEPYNNLAVLHAAGGRIDMARQLLETALRHDPAYATAHENLGDVYVRLAEREYERAGSARSTEALQQKLRLARELAAAAR